MIHFDLKNPLASLQKLGVHPVKVVDKKILSAGPPKVSCLILSDGSRKVLKERYATTDQFWPDFFQREGEGLHRIREVVKKYHLKLAVPEPLGFFEGKDYSYLLMEYLPRLNVAPSSKAWEEFGRTLAQFHLHSRNEKNLDNLNYGLSGGNYLGNAVQKNDWTSDWKEFFKEKRIRYQLNWVKARKIELFQNELAEENFLARITECLPSHPPSCLVHGDLWHGNTFFTQDQIPALFDPAVYYGHHEVDLSMSELFGGFDPHFYTGYYDEMPPEKGWKVRREVYHFYHLLNHLNLFGGIYLDSVLKTISEFSK